MNSAIDLLKAIRSGRLQEVLAVLDAGAPVELLDGRGDPGLPLGVACFMGFPDIVRELVRRGAKVNTADNSLPTSPVSMAVRGKRKEVLKVLIELGAEIPPGLNTGLSEQEILVARWRGQHYGAAMPRAADAAPDAPAYEEIEMVGCYGTDTSVLDADLIRAAREMEKK